MTYGKLLSIPILALGLGWVGSHAQTYVVDGPGNLTTQTNLIKSSFPGGVRRVQFKSYQDVGNFSADGINVDSLIFERFEESTEALNVSGKMFQIQGAMGHVVFRNLAFKLSNGSAVILEGIGSSRNKSLLFDSCVIFGDSIGSTFLSWASSTGNKIEIRRSIFSSPKGGEAKIDLSADSVRLGNNYFNYSGTLVATTPKSLEMVNNTTNRIQFRFNGDFTGVYSIQRNLFGFPPIQNKIPGDPNKYIMTLLGFGSSTATGNARFPSWSGYEFTTISAFAEAQNPTVAAFGDSTAMWSFLQQGDTQRGYQNPTSSRYPSYSVFPRDSILGIQLSAKDSISISFAPAQIPRIITAAYATRTYPATWDSLRTLWIKDTAVQVSGPLSLRSMAFPKATPQGLPLLFTEAAGVFTAGATGKDGDLVFQPTSSTSKILIPAFAGQNTSRGTQVAVKGLSPDTSLRFSTISRAGRTFFKAPEPGTPRKRWRPIQKGGAPFGYRDSTTAEGSGLLRFGLQKAGTAEAFRPDSLTWWIPGDTFRPVTDSAGKYWGDVPFNITSQALLLERLSLGAGKDTLPHTQGRLVSTSSTGFQASIDSSYQPAEAAFSDMGNFSKGLSFSIQGRAAGDSLLLEWKKTSKLQKAYLKQGDKAVAATPVRDDSSSLSLYLGPGDTNQVLFLARKYAVAAGVKTTMALGQDTVKDLISSKPGDIALDTGVSLTGLQTDSLRILSKRQVILDNLTPTGEYSVVLQGLTPNRDPELKAFVRRAARWDSTTVTFRNGFFIFKALPGDLAWVAAERLRAGDTLPIIPASNPTLSVEGGRLSIQPVLTPAEAARLKGYTVEVFTLDVNGKPQVETSKSLPGDSAFILLLNGGKYYSARIAYESFSGKVTWKTLAAIPQDAKAFLNAALAIATPFKPAVWELVGFPWTGTAKQDLRPHFTAKELVDLHLEEWKGSWTPVGEEAPLLKGRGYLAGFPKEFRPKAPTAYSFAFVPETLSLDIGWQLVSNPFPFALAESAIKKDAGALSFFYELAWNGTGKAAKPVWTLADTLKPFKGYAVHATAPTKIVFDPTSLAPAAKVAGTAWRREVRFSVGAELRAQLRLEPTTAARPSPAAPLFKGGLTAHWSTLQGPVSLPWASQTAINEAFVLAAPEAQEVSLALGNRVGETPGSALGIWMPNQQALVPAEGARLRLEAGENWFRLVEVPGGAWAETEAALRRAEPGILELLPNFPNPFGRTTRLRFTIPLQAGSQRQVEVEIRGLTGRMVFRQVLRQVGPGRHTLDVDGTSWSPGQYLVRATFIASSGRKVLQRKMLRLGEMP